MSFLALQALRGGVMDKPSQVWDEVKDAQKFGQLKREGCHFQPPSVLQWFQRRVEARGLARRHGPTTAFLYGSWWHEKDKVISFKDVWRLYGVSRNTAKRLYELICDEFDLELVPVKTQNGRDKGFILKGVSPTAHTHADYVVQEAVCDSTKAQVCNAERTGMQPTDHPLETKQEAKQETISTTITDKLSVHEALIRRFLIGKSYAARSYLEEELSKIQAKYGDEVVESQLQQGIAKEWKSISLSNYEQFNKASVDDRVLKHPCYRVFTADHGFLGDDDEELSVLDKLIPT
jgi:hypothetical protein